MASTLLSRLFRGVAVTATLGAVATAATVLGGGVATTATLTSCISTDSYLYTAQKYDPDNDCVNAYSAVEVVKGSGASAVCPRTCLMVGDDLYVSTLCPPLPAIASAVDSDAGTCIAALAAAATGGTCDAPAPTEGGADEAGAEAGDEDADMDASGEPDAADASRPPMDASDAG